MDPGQVPTELQGLTQIEEMLTSVMPMMSLYHLPYGQYGYSGHVINLPQDISTFTSTLPRSPSQSLFTNKMCMKRTKISEFEGRRSTMLYG